MAATPTEKVAAMMALHLDEKGFRELFSELGGVGGMERLYDTNVRRGLSSVDAAARANVQQVGRVASPFARSPPRPDCCQ